MLLHKQLIVCFFVEQKQKLLDVLNEIICLSLQNSFVDAIQPAFETCSVGTTSVAEGTDFFDGALGAEIFGSDEEDDGIDKAEGVLQHESFHFTVKATAPVRTSQEAPADLDF